ncbi:MULTISPECIES: sulfate ABC transporter substrate-binding protein [Pseudomonas]|jgi:sulfate transport system substrate-binding protein|uniref:sulfate ABC transporter substrate-binding protein n=1 Tax=Pseudomonas TaxID=286 RepID=UPI001C81CE4E|nr:MULTISPECIES: sulfate ABC transporter substrate-binding protein [Pseudomonas]MDG9931293.1 sulfate ABC transporter substrate-binding protein [Pseudomonas sp. GD04042]MDH0485968.1 sulfate ABC transporter substrate-binding protein [Pseudomonas sp. GD04015]MDH0606640.1 sulfate ABC transporter substrate-binding protein [Pseudomonas sp. GD03869]MDH0897039.1 sulfate ABC transporter substrate-binding protein [Pseudomonas sp. GD03875]MDH1066950.1 sulfate ABC transporter substrate-binding protein [Ps
MSIRRFALAALATALFAGPTVAATEILNVSYDPTRELYQEYNAAFNKHWTAQGKEAVTIQQSHGGSGKQARAVIDGLRADVVTLALAGDIDELYKLGKLIPEDWQSRLPQSSTPYTSTIVFLVRKGNPKGIKDWGDLTKDGVEVITPNPKTSGGARWNFLAAWAYAQQQYGSEEKAKEFVEKLYKNVPVLDTGARGSTITFVNNQIGDVLLAWENEAFLALKEQGGDQFEIVAPSLSILAEPPVAVVDKNVDKKGTREVATAYLQYLYSDEGQRIAAKHFYRPRNEQVAAEFAKQFPQLKLVTIDKDFNGWKEAQPKFFNDGGIFDQIYQAH